MGRKAKKPKTELKKRALLAKQRLRMGYWKTMTEEKVQMLSEMGINYNTVQLVKGIQQAKLDRDVKKMINSSQALKDEIFYSRVREVLDKDEYTINPIGQLVDHEVYDSLDEENKQRYILELSKKFREMRDRYYQERVSKTC